MMKTPTALWALLFCLSQAAPALAGISLVTTSDPREVRLTVYQPADLCLVRERREPTLQPGANRLEISWAGTLIDPTSLEMTPLRVGDETRVIDLAFPPRTRARAVWTLDSETGGSTPVSITYLTSGLSWHPVYTATLTGDEKALRLEGAVRITNRSGKDYEGAQVSVLTGDINLVDPIADLARREAPYGTPPAGPRQVPSAAPAKMDSMVMKRSIMALEQAAAPGPPEITARGVSDFFLFTIEGTESIPDKSSISLRMLDAAGVPVTNLYKCDESRYGSLPVRFVTFKNGGPAVPGAFPLPPGDITVYRGTGPDGSLSFEGRSPVPHVPAGETAELNLGPVTDVTVEARLLEEATARYEFDRKGNVSGWDGIHRWELEVLNTRPVSVRVQIDRHASTAQWEIEHDAGEDSYKKVDKRTFRFEKSLEPGERSIFGYRLTTPHGTRVE